MKCAWGANPFLQAKAQGGCLVPEEDMRLYCMSQVQNPHCFLEHQCAALGDPCSLGAPLVEAAAGAGWRGGTLLCDGRPWGGGNSVLSTVGGLRTPALLPGASEVLAALLMASSTRGFAKCAFWRETGKKVMAFAFLFLGFF